ncbi:MAG: hypothetical protein IJT03_02325, partial [Clostridia bacterium]|nr:hypothetical protein [Clostridia bacterium]
APAVHRSSQRDNNLVFPPLAAMQAVFCAKKVLHCRAFWAMIEAENNHTSENNEQFPVFEWRKNGYEKNNFYPAEPFDGDKFDDRVCCGCDGNSAVCISRRQ